MNRAHAFDGKRASRGWAYARLAVLTTVLASLAPVVCAQEVDIVGPLTEGVRCSSTGAKDDLGVNIKKLEKPDDVIGAALNRVAADQTRCEPMRVAAADLANTYVFNTPPTVGELAAEAARLKLVQALAEADQRARTLKFEMGPPPRNMTRGSKSTHAFGH